MSVLAASSSAFDQPGTLGFLVVAGMGVVLVFLFRSMTRHLRKVTGTAKPPGRGRADTEGSGIGSPGASAAETTNIQNE